MSLSIDDEWSMFLQNQDFNGFSTNIDSNLFSSSSSQKKDSHSGGGNTGILRNDFPGTKNKKSKKNMKQSEEENQICGGIAETKCIKIKNGDVSQSNEKKQSKPNLPSQATEKPFNKKTMFRILSTPRPETVLFTSSNASINLPSFCCDEKIEKESSQQIDALALQATEKPYNFVPKTSYLVPAMPSPKIPTFIPRRLGGDDLYISTKTKVLYFNQPIDIQNVFWRIPIIEYWKQEEGVIKKQIKIVCKTPEETQEYKDKLKNISYYREHIIKQVNNPTARVLKYKDERKITVGINKKDIINLRGKIKNAFYNCFVIIIRFKYEGIFREIHVKVFNTGKMEIPGVFNKEHLNIVKDKILSIVEPLLFQEKETSLDESLDESPDESPETFEYKIKKLEITEPIKDENVLINSNFNCGFYIDRERLYNILTTKYGIECSFDPCSYPGVKCKYYFNNEKSFEEDQQNGQITNQDRRMKMCDLGDYKKYTEVSFMVFRTGSCLIVGNCSEQILRFIFQFLKNVLFQEYSYISIINENLAIKEKKMKQKKRKITVTSQYFQRFIDTSLDLPSQATANLSSPSQATEKPYKNMVGEVKN